MMLPHAFYWWYSPLMMMMADRQWQWKWWPLLPLNLPLAPDFPATADVATKPLSPRQKPLINDFNYMRMNAGVCVCICVFKAGLRQNGDLASSFCFSYFWARFAVGICGSDAQLSSDGSLRGAQSGAGAMSYSSANEQIDAGDNVAAALIATA